MRCLTRPMLSKVAVAAIALATLLAVVPGTAAVSVVEAAPPGRGKPITVMTRNIYLGADIQRPIAATAGKTGLDALNALANANHTVGRIVDQTNFPVRSTLLAREIARTKPDLIGLQEVALWRHGPLELQPDRIGVPNATEVDYDFLQILLDSLGAAGADYSVVQAQVESDVEAPSFTGTLPNISDAMDKRLTIRDVILQRDDAGLTILDKGGANYRARLNLTIGGIPASFVRGYDWADVQAGSTTFRFINTHLEAYSSDLALAQAAELLAGPGRYPGTTIFVCDCNSDPLNDTVKPTDPLGTPHSGPYKLITGPGGFTDEWLEFKPADKGWTSGLGEFVDDPDASGFDHRIDMIFGRAANGDALSVHGGKVTGNKVSDRDRATGLWPSDHAGVVLSLRSPHPCRGHRDG